MILKNIRLILAVVSFVLITFFFVDFAGIFPTEHFHLSKIQLFPALLSGGVFLFCILILLTLLLGRIYCSVICPLGILQDVMGRISKLFNKKRKSRFLKPHSWLRYSILILTVLTFFLGWSVIFGLLEPYSAFGRIATHLLKPVYQAVNNLLAAVFNHYGNYTFFHAVITVDSVVSLVTAAATLLLVGYMSWKYGRLYCNTICPAGTILGLASRFSIFRVRIDKNKCNLCGKCERNCKSSCIDSQNGEIDSNRCVACFNCLSSCKQKAIHYRFVFEEGPKDMSLESGSGFLKQKAEGKPDNPEKRRFLSLLALTTVTATSGLLAQGVKLHPGGVAWKRKTPVSPPGAVGAEHLQKHCTSCHLCVSKCPARVLRPAWLEYGAGGIMQPVLDFDLGFCNYDCTLCSEVCPNEAIHRLNKEEKHLCQMGQVVFVQKNCVVYTDETHCGACSEHCPTQAVSMVPYKDGLTIPSVNPEICVGCGACEYVCPAEPFKAIHVEGNPVQLQAKPFDDNGATDVKLDQFGF